MRPLYAGLLIASVFVCAMHVTEYKASKAPKTSTAIVGGTLLDVRTGKEIENSVALIRGDRITDVGLAGKLQIPSEARVVDAHGKWIIPGLIDTHAHLWANKTPRFCRLACFWRTE